MMEEPTQAPPPQMDTETEPITRSSSTSTLAAASQTAQQVVNNLANLSALANASPVASSPQQRPVAIAPAMCPPGTSPASTHPGPGGNLPTCQNCETSTTPLWRRDEMGSVLCNACGLFLKLHGRARPISLKTDVIKSRNRVKTMRPDLAKQKKQNQATGDMNGMDQNGVRRTSQKSNGHDDTNSPISRNGTPNMYNQHMAPMYHTLDDQFQAQQLAAFSVTGAPDGRAASPLNGERLQSHDQLEAMNSQLKTRVSELEVIQELYRGRLQQLEEEEKLRQSQEAGKIEAQLRAEISMLSDTQAQLANQLEESHRRENMLKRRLDELEIELRDAREPQHQHQPQHQPQHEPQHQHQHHRDDTEPLEEDGHIAKKARIEEEVQLTKLEHVEEPAVQLVA